MIPERDSIGSHSTRTNTLGNPVNSVLVESLHTVMVTSYVFTKGCIVDKKPLLTSFAYGTMVNTLVGIMTKREKHHSFVWLYIVTHAILFSPYAPPAALYFSTML